MPIEGLAAVSRLVRVARLTMSSRTAWRFDTACAVIASTAFSVLLSRLACSLFFNENFASADGIRAMIANAAVAARTQVKELNMLSMCGSEECDVAHKTITFTPPCASLPHTPPFPQNINITSKKQGAGTSHKHMCLSHVQPARQPALLRPASDPSNLSGSILRSISRAAV
jgi:hypothetical protein